MDEPSREKQEIMTQGFWIGLQSIGIFGLPAALSAVAGRKLDLYFSSGYTFTIGLLVMAFIASWGLYFLLYRRLLKKFRETGKLK